MCGVAGIYLNDPTHPKLPSAADQEKFINGLLKGIEHRGKDATGIVAVQRGSTQPHLEKADVEASKFIEWRRPLPEQWRTALLHTRAATKGSPTNLDNNHPVVHKTCFVTHNGHISNDDELFKDFKLERFAQVDSEAIPALIDKFGLDKVHLALQELLGGFAIAAIQPEKHPDVLVLAKGTNSPLEYIETPQGIIWASTRQAIRDAWKEVWDKEPEWRQFESLKEGEILYIEDGVVEKLQFKVKPRPVTKYSGGSGSNWSSGYHGSYQRLRNDPHVHRRICKCGETQWKHSGTNCEGFCIKSDCRCTKFVQHRYQSKREWRKTDEYKRIVSEREAERKRIKARGAATTETTTVHNGPLKFVYEKGIRKTLFGNIVKSVEFKCEGCTEYKPIEQSEDINGYRFCYECWGEECTSCMDFFAPDDLKEVEEGGLKWWLCPDCYEILNAETPAAEVIVPRGQSRGQSEGLRVDNMAVKLAAEELACKASFVYELLFDLDASEILAETWLEHAYKVTKEKYIVCLRDLHEGLPQATSKALAIPDEPKSPGEAVHQRTLIESAVLAGHGSEDVFDANRFKITTED